jgi:hypothetical protein
MRYASLGTRLFAFLLLTVACPAFAQTPPPPPFTISFASAQFTAAENSIVDVILKCAGPAPANMSVNLDVRIFPSDQESSYGFAWGAAGAPEHHATFNFDDNYYNPGRTVVFTITSVSNGGAIGTPASTTLTIADDEKQPMLFINDVTVDEGTTSAGVPQKNAVFTIGLTAGLPNSTFIPVTLHEQSAKNGVDFLWPNPGTLFFAPGQTSTTLTIPIVGDSLPEADETFSVELTPPPNVIAEKTIGTCTILDDDGAVTPQNQRIAVCEKGAIHIRLGNPAVTTEQVILQVSDPDLLAAPGAVPIAAGTADADAEFTGLKPGAGSILATLPPSRGGRTYELLVTVHDNTTVILDPMELNLSLGASANVTARIDPPPASPVHIFVQTAKSGVVSVPDILTTGADGRLAIPVHATGLGATTVNVAMLDVNGGASADLGVNVTLGPGPVITSVVPTLGRATGGESVRINGFNFSERCAVSFDGIPVPGFSALPGGGALNVLTPPHDAGIVDIAVRCDTRSFVFPGSFAYQGAPAKVTTISPKSGTVRGGTIVSIIGTDFRFDSCSVRFGQTTASLISNLGNTSFISVESPAHAVGSVDVSLVCGSQTVTLPGAFSYVASDDLPATLVSSFGLKQGSSAGMSGSSFRRDDEVLLNGVVLQDMTTPDSGEHFFTLPEIAGQAALTLRDYAGRSLTRTVTITAPDTPAVTKVPDRVTLGSEFSITGTALRPGLTYMLGPAPVQLIPNPVISPFSRSICASCSPATAVFRAPISVGPGTASFTIADHGTLLVTRSVEVTTSGPTVSSITPPCAAVEGGSLVTIAGSGFDDGAAVQFGTTQSIDVVVKDRFTIMARVPPPFGFLQPQITVFNPDGSAATLTNAFTYKSAADGGCGGTGGGRHRATGH